MNGNGLKPGIYSTEAWFTILSQVAGLAILFGWVQPGDAKSLEDALKQIIVASTTVVTNGIILYNYVHSRHNLKLAALSNGNGKSNGNGNVPSSIPQIGTKVKS